MTSYEEHEDQTHSARKLPPLQAAPSYLEILPPPVEPPITTVRDHSQPFLNPADASSEAPPKPPVEPPFTSSRPRPPPTPVEPPPSIAGPRPPPPPPPPSIPPQFQSAFSEAVHPGESEDLGMWDSPYDWSGLSGNKSQSTVRPEVSPADVVVVHTAADLSLVRCDQYYCKKGVIGAKHAV